MTDLPKLIDAEEFFISELKETYMLLNTAEKLKILDAFRKSVVFLVKAHAAHYGKLIEGLENKASRIDGYVRYMEAKAARDAVLGLAGLK